MKAGQTITIERRAIYANTQCSERAVQKTIESVKDIEGQDAQIIKFKGDKRSFRKTGNFLNVYYPRNAKYEIVS